MTIVGTYRSWSDHDWSRLNRAKNNAKTKRWQKLNPSKTAEMCRKVKLRRLGTTPEEADAALVRQGSACAICGLSGRFEKGGLAVDHCHQDGSFRAVLCARCNVGLGMFQDEPSLLEIAIEYLKGGQDANTREAA